MMIIGRTVSYLYIIYFFLQDELMAELEELEQEQLDEQLLEVGTPSADINLPSVPASEPIASTKSKFLSDYYSV